MEEEEEEEVQSYRQNLRREALQVLCFLGQGLVLPDRLLFLDGRHRRVPRTAGEQVEQEDKTASPDWPPKELSTFIFSPMVLLQRFLALLRLSAVKRPAGTGSRSVPGWTAQVWWRCISPDGGIYFKLLKNHRSIFFFLNNHKYVHN